MSERKRKPRLSDMPFDEALARFIQTNPDELAEEVASDVLKGRQRAKKRIADARREIEDGARPKKGRFRL
jgi:hypothetical protein